MPVTRSYLR